MEGLFILIGIIHLIVVSHANINIATDHSNPHLPQPLTPPPPPVPSVYYYDLKDGQPLDGGVLDQDHHPLDNNNHERNVQRISFRSNGCSCQTMTCGCCTGINIQQFNFHREGCMNFTYDPDEFSIMMNMFMDSNEVFSNTISAKNPPPLCLPFEVPYLPSVAFCAKLFDVHTPGQNLQMCLDFETRVQQAPIFVLHFDCMRMGTAGIAFVKPGDTLSTIVPIVDALSGIGVSTEGTVTDIDIYDEVTEGNFTDVNM